ncbi:MAG: ester cyclase [Pseudomonadota bacterium]
MTSSSNNRFVDNKRRVIEGLRSAASCSTADTISVLSDFVAPTVRAHFFEPINELAGRESLSENFFGALKKSFPDLARAETIVLSGESDGAEMVATTGHYVGTFAHDWLGIPATHKVTQLRFGETHRVEDGLITETWVIIDVIDVLRQAGVALTPPSLGAEGLWLPPGDGSGVDIYSVDSEKGAETLRFSREMQETLMQFDGKSLASMKQERYWSPTFLWFGPGGIGTTRGLQGFQAHHQIPFLIAFPDRRGGQHLIRMGDGMFAVTGGWPSVTATHTGDGWLGLAASGRNVRMRVMDFYRVDRGKIVENWVPLDIVHVLKQIGYDVFERLAHLRGQPRLQLPWEE